MSKIASRDFSRAALSLKDLLDIENEMMYRSVADPNPAAVFLDFASAFPSIPQEYIMESLARAGVPSDMRNAFSSLCHENKCSISVKGGTFNGFSMHSGVRQGCPLSPIVYALVAEDLLDLIDDLVPGCFTRILRRRHRYCDPGLLEGRAITDQAVRRLAQSIWSKFELDQVGDY